MLARQQPLRSRHFFFFFNDTATTEIYTLSLHDALPIHRGERGVAAEGGGFEGPSGTVAGCVAGPRPGMAWSRGAVGRGLCRGTGGGGSEAASLRFLPRRERMPRG